MPEFQGPGPTTKRAKAIADAKAAGYTDDEISAELARQDAATDESPLTQSLPSPKPLKIPGVMADASTVSRTPRADPGFLGALSSIVPANAMNMAESALDVGAVPGAVTDFLASALPGRTFQGNRDERQARRNSLSLSEALAAGFLPGLIPGNAGAMFNANLSSSIPKYAAAALAAANTKGLRGVALRAGGRLRDAAFTGATTGFGENIGTTSGVVAPTVLGLLGGGVIGTVGAPTVRGAGWLAEHTPYIGPLAKKLMGRGPQMSKAEQGALEYAEVAEAATPSRFTNKTIDHPSQRVIDEAGPELEELFRAAANTPKGHRLLSESLPSRSNEGWDALMASLSRNTDVTPQEAEQMALMIADLKRSRVATDVADKAKHYEFELAERGAHDAAKAASEVKPTQTSVLDAMESQYGKPGSVLALLELRDTMIKEADEVYYAEARRLSSERGISEPKNWDEIKNTAVGMEAVRNAERVGHAAALNDPRRAVPTTEIGELGSGAGPKFVNRGTEDIAHAAKGEAMFMAGQTPATPPRNSPAERSAAMELAKSLKPNISPEFQLADDMHKANAEAIRRVEQGLTLPRSNPGPGEYRTGSLEARQKSQAKLSTDQLRESQLAQQAALYAEVQDGKSPEALIKELQDPRSTKAQAWDMAFGKGSAESFSNLFRVPDAPASYSARPAPLPAIMTPREQQATRGLDILKTKTIPNSDNPELSLAELERYITKLPQDQQEVVRQYAAAQFQAKIAARNPLNLSVPENLRQLAVATGTPEGAQRVAATEAAWEKSRALDASLLGSKGPARKQDRRGIPGFISDIYSPSTPWMLAKAGRTLTSEAGNSAADAQGEELIKLALGGSGTMQQKIAGLRSIKGLNEAGQRRVATILARMFGVAQGESPP